MAWHGNVFDDFWTEKFKNKIEYRVIFTNRLLIAFKSDVSQDLATLRRGVARYTVARAQDSFVVSLFCR